MSKDVDVVQLRDENGEFVYVKTHLDAIDGMELYTESVIGIWEFIGHYILDSGWVAIDVGATTGVLTNTRYSGNGFKCAIRQTKINGEEYGNGNFHSTKTIRINAENFTSGMQIFQLPQGFVTEPVRFQMSGSGHRLPYTLEITMDGKVMVFVHPSEQNNSSTSNWIYGQYTWME